MPESQLASGDVLIVVDVQNDFCPGGALPVPDGDAVVLVLNAWIAHAQRTGNLVVASRDWHPRQHISFEGQGGPWPEHCLQDSEGAAFHPELELPDDVVKVSKGVRLDKDQYSAFDDTGLAAFLRERGAERLWVGGLAQEVCVHATIMSAREAGFDTVLIAEATRPIDAEAGRKALQAMQHAGARTTEQAA